MRQKLNWAKAPFFLTFTSILLGLSSCSVELVDERKPAQPLARATESGPGWQLIGTEEPNQYLLNLDEKLQVEVIEAQQIIGEQRVPRVFNGKTPVILEGGGHYQLNFKELNHQIEVKVPRDLEIKGTVDLKEGPVGRFIQGLGHWEVAVDGRIFIATHAQLNVTDQKLLLRAKELIGQGGTIRTFSANATAGVGEAGRNGGEIDIQVSRSLGLVHIELYGQNGGNGSPGRPPAAPAAAGANLSGQHINDRRCHNRPPGPQGSAGARGLPGSAGGKGGSGGTLKINVTEKDEAKYLIRGGSGQGGEGGEGGPGQAGGQGGLGPTTGWYHCERIDPRFLRWQPSPPQNSHLLVTALLSANGAGASQRPMGIQPVNQVCDAGTCPNSPVRGPNGPNGAQGPKGPAGTHGESPGRICYRGENQCQNLPAEFLQHQWVEFKGL